MRSRAWIEDPGTAFFIAGLSRKGMKRHSEHNACGKGSILGCHAHGKSFSNSAIEAEASAGATLRENGTGSRAEPWLSKVRTLLRRCARFSKVRIMENPGDS